MSPIAPLRLALPSPALQLAANPEQRAGERSRPAAACLLQRVGWALGPYTCDVGSGPSFGPQIGKNAFACPPPTPPPYAKGIFDPNRRRTALLSNVFPTRQEISPRR
jgi:hypothetical protein